MTDLNTLLSFARRAALSGSPVGHIVAELDRLRAQRRALLALCAEQGAGGASHLPIEGVRRALGES